MFELFRAKKKKTISLWNRFRLLFYSKKKKKVYGPLIVKVMDCKMFVVGVI